MPQTLQGKIPGTWMVWNKNQAPVAEQRLHEGCSHKTAKPASASRTSATDGISDSSTGGLPV